MDNDLPLGLARKETYASLSPSELESLGKRASNMYLLDGIPLNEAVIKVASENPSISTHQVRRIVEFANTETFQRLFEKQASDKNVEFDVADPGVVLRSLDTRAQGHTMSLAPSEYSSEPIKMATSDIAADIELCRAFGVDPALPGTEETTLVVMEKKASAGSPITEVLHMMKVAQPPLMAGPMMGEGEEEPQAAVRDQHHEQLLSLERQIEIEKKKQELVNIQQKTFEMLNPQPEMDPNMQAQQGQPQQGMEGDQSGQLEQAMPQQDPQAPEMGEGAPSPVYGPNGEVIARGPQTKMSSVLVKEAMQYANTSAGLSNDQLLYQLREATSVGRIKKATATRPEYPEANPYGELFRTKQKLASLTEDALHAKDRNEMLLKEAEENWIFQVKQHLLNDGNIGEVAHVIDSVDGREDNVKLAMRGVAPMLDNPRFNAVRMQAQSIQYEMEKGARVRVLNPQNPLVEAYAALVKVADGQRTLDAAYQELHGLLNEVEQEVRKVCVA